MSRPKSVQQIMKSHSAVEGDGALSFTQPEQTTSHALSADAGAGCA